MPMTGPRCWQGGDMNHRPEESSNQRCRRSWYSPVPSPNDDPHIMTSGAIGAPGTFSMTHATPAASSRALAGPRRAGWARPVGFGTGQGTFYKPPGYAVGWTTVGIKWHRLLSIFGRDPPLRDGHVHRLTAGAQPGRGEDVGHVRVGGLRGRDLAGPVDGGHLGLVGRLVAVAVAAPAAEAVQVAGAMAVGAHAGGLLDGFDNVA